MKRLLALTRNKSYNKKMLFFLAVLSLTVLTISLCLVSYYKSNNQVNVATRTVNISTFHSIYYSVEEMVGVMMRAEDISLIAEAVVIDNGAVRSVRDVSDESVPPDVHTDYKIRIINLMKGEAGVKEVTIALMGGVVDGVSYEIEGAPSIKKGDRIVVFAYHGRDGRYYPLSGSTAIALIDRSGNYNLTGLTIAGKKRSFTIQDLKGFIR